MQYLALINYNFTSLNFGISEVLMGIKKDPEFHKLPKIPGNPPKVANREVHQE
jgi:hypothetical protein